MENAAVSVLETDGVTEARKTAWRTLREAVLRVALEEDVLAAAVVDAVLPILEHLTGRSGDLLKKRCMERLVEDGRLEIRQTGGTVQFAPTPKSWPLS